MENKTRAEILAANLKQIRTERGVSRKELAEAVGITQNLLGLYETARRVPPLDKIFSLADALQVPLTDIIGENAYSDADRKISEYRLQQALNLAAAARCHSTKVHADGTVSANLPIEFVPSGKSNMLIVKHRGEIMKFQTGEDFASFIEEAEFDAARGKLSLGKAIEKLAFEKSVVENE